MLALRRIYQSAAAAESDRGRLKAQGFVNAEVRLHRDLTGNEPDTFTIAMDTPLGRLALMETDALAPDNPAVTADQLMSIRWMIYELHRSAAPAASPAYDQLSQVKGLLSAAARELKSS